MKKNLYFALFMAVALAVSANYAQAAENKVLKTEEKEAQIIDDTKMQPDEILNKKSEKEAKKLEKERLKQAKKEQRQALKEEKKALKEKTEPAKEEKEILPVSEEKKIEPAKEEVKAPKEEEPSEIKEVKNEEAPAAEPDKDKKEAAEIKEAKPEPEKEPAPGIYRKNLTYEDIDKNAVSINEFLQFTDKQNEKFSLFYYKTTAKLNSYSDQIKAKEAQIKALKSEDVGNKAKYDKLKKLDKEYDALMKERDDFYNDSLQKFNSMLTKKQAIKWEILQQMGYRFLPEN